MVRFSLNHWLLIGCPIVHGVHTVFMTGDNLSRKSKIFCLRTNLLRRVGLLGQILLVNELASFVHGLKLSWGMDGLWNY